MNLDTELLIVSVILSHQIIYRSYLFIYVVGEASQHFFAVVSVIVLTN